MPSTGCSTQELGSQCEFPFPQCVSFPLTETWEPGLRETRMNTEVVHAGDTGLGAINLGALRWGLVVMRLYLGKAQA